MAIFQKTTGVCHGRGFSGADPSGYMAKFQVWVTGVVGDGGANWYMVDDQSSETNPYIVVSDTENAGPNEYNTAPNGGAPKFMKIGYVASSAGEIYTHCWAWWDATAHTGYGFWAGYLIRTYDDADFVYDFRGGGECMIVQSRRGTSWDSMIYDDFVGDNNLVEDETHVGTVQSLAASGSSVTIQLASGEASNFTADKYYYIYNFSGAVSANYVQCTATDSGLHQITVDTTTYNYPSGSVIGSYPIRHWCVGDYTADTTSYLTSNNRRGNIPFTSSSDGDNPSDRMDGAFQYPSLYSYVTQCFKLEYANAYLSEMAPDDEGNYAVQRPAICEYYQHNEELSYSEQLGNRGYGVCKNIYLSAKGSLAAGQDGRIINGNNWLFFQDNDSFFSQYGSITNLAVLVPDTVSAA